jgi:hypothetical protein
VLESVAPLSFYLQKKAYIDERECTRRGRLKKGEEKHKGKEGNKKECCILQCSAKM